MLEQRVGGRLGILALDTATGRTSGWRADERFAHCSSFKLSLAALVLHGARAGRWSLDERLVWSSADLLGNSPATTAALETGLTMRELAAAIQISSDNAGANVLLRRVGGPEALNEFWRGLGDTTSRLDRYEPDLNRVPPGTSLDTSTPAAMARTVALLVTGDVLAAEDRDLLKSWMIATATGLRRLRAGFPADWIAGDKTGTAYTTTAATYVDLAFGGPAGGAPLVIAAYFEPAAPMDSLDPAAEAVLAEVGRLCAQWPAA